jgi:APA family basic amino acid/polyamine antiporter
MSSSSEQPNLGLSRHVKLRSATFLVIANMIGAGIFTTTGFQAADIGHPGLIFALWITGGVLALCGALCYAELGAAMPEAGGEYVYLRNTYGEAFGFMSAFVSLIAGFSAPIASATLGFTIYLFQLYPALSEISLPFGFVGAADLLAVVIVWALIGIQLRGARAGMRFMDNITLVKIAGIVFIILAAAAVGDGDLANFSTVSASYSDLSFADQQAALGTSLIFVMFCYSGWNASAYLAGEFENPQRDLPKSLLLGTAAVVILYIGLNAMYFYGAPVDELAGKVEVGLVSARRLFGDTGVVLTTGLLLISLLASASAMTMAGPRVYYAVGRDFPSLRRLASTSGGGGTPRTALLVQGIVTTFIILIGRIDQIMQYAGFTLTLFASLAVSCVIVLRVRQPDLPRPFRTWGYPVTPLLFLAVSLWMMFWSARGRPLESVLAFLTVLGAWIVFKLTSGGRSGMRGSGPQS